MEAIIRPYHPTDIGACRALWAELTQAHRDLYEDQTIGGEAPGAWFDRHLSDPRLAGLWVAEVEGQVVGMVGLLIEGEEGEIEPLVVAKGHRHQGIGSQLLNHAVREARKPGLRFLSVRPVARNAAAIALFVEAGFRLLGRIELFQEMDPSSGRSWIEGVTIHGHRLRY